MNKAEVLERVADLLISGSKEHAVSVIANEYPFMKKETFHRSYSLKQKMKIFLRDGFIDRYTGEKLINPGMLKILSEYFPDEFPYHKNGKMTEGHIAYWDLFPTIDHVVPIAAGGLDNEDNWVSTSMFNNSIKSNWTLEQLRWTLHNPGKIDEWDGLTSKFVTLVEADKSLLNAPYIKNWYNAAKVHINIPNEEIIDEALII